MTITSLRFKNVTKDVVHTPDPPLNSPLNNSRLSIVLNLTIQVHVLEMRFVGFMTEEMEFAKNSSMEDVMEMKTDSRLEANVRLSVGILKTFANCE